MSGRPASVRPAGLVALVLLGALVRPTAGEETIAADPLPARETRSMLAPRPWFGHSPRGDETAEGALDEVVSFSPWRGLLWARSQWQNPRPRALRATPDEAGPAPVSGSFLALESAEFLAGWNVALSRGEAGDVAGTRFTVAALRPRTLDGERLARELAFAAAVADEDLAAADSLYWRLSWPDAARARQRILAWQALRAGRGSDAVSSLEGISDPTPGERGALAMARWMATPERSGPETGPTAGEAAGPAGVALTLAAARNALLAGDRAGAAAELASLSTPDIPAPWRDAEERLRALAEGGPETGQGTADETAYREVLDAFLAGRDDAARDRADDWLRRWPDSSYRPQVYWMRAWMRARSGDVGGASEDLRAVEKLGGTEIQSSADRLQAFVLGQEGKGSEALAMLNARTPQTPGEEAEALFDRARLGRLVGNGAEVAQSMRLLEEAFPNEVWYARARTDTVAAAWRTPWRTAPPSPAGAAIVSAPTEGPWGRLLWGNDVLPTTSVRLAEETARLDPGFRPPTPDETEKPPVEELAPEPESEGVPTVLFTNVGFGIPAGAELGLGAGGGSESFRYRAEGSFALGEQRNELPSFERARWGASVGLGTEANGVSLEAEGDGRRDDGATGIPVDPEPVGSRWRGVRLQGGLAGETTRGNLALALARGKYDAGFGRSWETQETWISLGGRARVRGARWEGSVTVGLLDRTQPGSATEDYTYQDLRIVRQVAGIWYVGLRQGSYSGRVLVAPVGGVELPLGAGWKAWAATEPFLKLPSFRDLYVVNSDWNTPDLQLPAERRYLDLRGGLDWEIPSRLQAQVAVNAFKTDQLRTWAGEESLWVARALDDATGFKLFLSGAGSLGGLRLSARFALQSVRAEGDQVPYVPTYQGQVEAGYAFGNWRLGLATLGVRGREDDAHGSYGNFSRWDVEAAYLYRRSSMPLRLAALEFNLRIMNLANVEDRRWPGVPGTGRTFFAAVQATY